MFCLVYASTATELFPSRELLELLRQARDHNAAAGITGLLLYKKGIFMQALEGEETAVRAVYAKIGQDPRHHHVSTLLAIPTNERQFPQWSMGFKNIGELPVGPVPGYDPAPNLPPQPSDDPPWKESMATRLLTGFMRGN